MLGRGGAEVAGRVAHLREQRRRHLKQPQQFLIPGSGANIEQQRARSVGRIGRMHLPVGQAPQQVGIDSAEGQLALLGARAGAGNVVQHPTNLRRREIRIEQQPGALGHHLFAAVCRQARAQIGRAAILPDNRIADRLAGFAAPDECGLALVGDADGGNIPGRYGGLVQRRAHGRQSCLPDVVRIVLDPARMRIDLPELLLCDRQRSAVRAEYDRARRGGALIDGEDVSHQRSFPSRANAGSELLAIYARRRLQSCR